ASPIELSPRPQEPAGAARKKGPSSAAWATSSTEIIHSRGWRRLRRLNLRNLRLTSRQILLNQVFGPLSLVYKSVKFTDEEMEGNENEVVFASRLGNRFRPFGFGCRNRLQFPE